MKVAIIGYGKMGKTIEPILQERGHQIVLKITAENNTDLTDENLRKADVAIEFSKPESAVFNYMMCFKNKIPVVSGTTGWLDKLDEVLDAREKEKGSFFYAPNFSVGVAIFFKINEVLAQLMNTQENYDVIMEETHHTEKKDSPSGTAIKTAEIILSALDTKEKWEENMRSSDKALRIDTFRKDKVPGTHKVKYTSKVDEISIEHKAYSRKGFALGAVLAAEWIIGKEGFFEMSDMLSF